VNDCIYDVKSVYIKKYKFFLYYICLSCIFAASNTNAEGNERIPITPITMQIVTEEGKLRQGFSEAVANSDSLDLKSDSSFQPPINYPVGKPLEVNLIYKQFLL